MSKVARTLLAGLIATTAFAVGVAPAEGGDSELTIFHAGSLAVPFRQLCREFTKLHPGLRIRREVAGSRICARKVSALGKRCDVLACADYTVIEDLLINTAPPRDAEWVIKFAGNEMVIAFRKGWDWASRINRDNWPDVLLSDRVAFGRSDPNSDPCGYRSLLLMQLAERFYGRPGLARQLAAKDRRYIRPKEIDLLALLEVGEIDCIFIYRSVAEQHRLKYMTLPESINLGSDKHAQFYRTASVRLSGKKPGTYITKQAEPIIYGVTIPKNAPNPQLAQAFLEFLLSPDKGGRILTANGQRFLVPSPSRTYRHIPPSLKPYARPQEEPPSK